ncbi:hypothetical protein GCM10010172_04510 [Paractinoplanes ferrugineus]|uniref:Uncharacterized protein n=1 Tax=Paractinoplanes ferrugineus TaxID=113564 RepID=A0A919JGL6_9ACTN|nr:hypothetical protein [Actinoplanes ferrugineus]GIE16836.1 hypothetical protein Afe05nite_86760 [Actinoplanes ferrugineus]
MTGEQMTGFASFFAGALLVTLLALWSDGCLSGWLRECRLDWRVRRIARRRDLDAAYRLLVQEEAEYLGEARTLLAEVDATLDELFEPWDSSGWLEDAPREDGAR